MSDVTPGPGTASHILFCTDFSENADRAFALAIDAAARRPGCKLFLLHVIPEPEAQFWKTYLYEVDNVDDRARADIDTKVQETYVPRVPPEVDLQVEMRIGNDAQQILEFAAEHDVDLIVIGRQGHSGLGKVFFGNCAERVVRKARCPVLVVPMPPAT